jgi:transcription antitermination factor NusG
MGKAGKKDEKLVPPDKWVCLCISERFANKEHYQAVRTELQAILGRGSAVLVVGEEIGEDCLENALGNYVFVRCPDIYARRKQLESSRYVRSILRSFTDIQFIDQSEIDAMTGHWREKQEEEHSPVRFGDVVQVRSGTFDKLHGIVIGKSGGDFEVRFRLFSGDFTSTFPSSMLTPGTNVFQLLKFPVTT